jgi:type I restriction-modification system DNA methylase subunit
MDKECAKEEIRVLLERYSQIMKKEREIKSKEEEMTKKDLIRPLFERALGWNFEEDVTAEEKVSKGWVDYGFRINGIPKFFLEAKALREDLDNPNFFQQAVNYAWYKGCTWAVLTNFETVKILNAEWEAPNYLYSHFMTIKCNEFLDRFDDLLLLSKESFEQGLLDKLAERFGKRTKKTTVDKQLLDDFTRFRDMLSKNIAKLNQKKKLTEEELDESVQRILNRLVFIRNCEDRGLEEKKLWEAKNEVRVWKKVKEAFEYYDTNYDSKLFTYDPTDSKKVHLCDTLDIDEGVMREIVDGLYRTKDKSISYDFSIIDADVLGTVYEQYLSHILKKTEKRAKIAENQTHRKEHGIYYTPIYIVDHIVRNTLGKLLKDKKVNIEKIRVLDPACGSGSFLIKAFDVVNEHHRKNDKDYSQTQLDSKTGTPFTKKVKILQKNIFGVDLDKQAVEIAQLNLLLKIAEKSCRLPLLEKNIKCGNSLIDDESVAGNRAFKWEEEFREIMHEGGFDVVIGNPPYVRVDNLKETDKIYWKGVFDSTQGKYDLYYLFIESVFDWLNDGGMCGFIVPNKFCAASSAKKLREIIVSHSSWCTILSVSHLEVFKDAANYPVILILAKGKGVDRINIESVRNQDEFLKKNFVNYWLGKEDLDVLPSKIFPINVTQEQFDLVIKLLKNNGKLSQYLKISEGLRIPMKLENSRVSSFEILKQFQFSKWSPINKGSYISKGDLEKVISPKSERYINSLKDKIVIAEDALSMTATVDFDKRIPQGGVYFGVIIAENIPLKYILVLLNSKLLSFVYNILYGGMHMGGGYMRYRTEFLEHLPIRIASTIQQHKMIKLADRMLSLNRHLSEIGEKRTDERVKVEQEIGKTDSEIDELIYGIYGITESEKKIIETA